MTRILIVDDRPINRQFLTTLLRYRGFETREANDGRQALDVVLTWPPDLAIVDIEMPVMNGIELVHRLHEIPELTSMPIIFYTASYEVTEAARIARECGVDEFLMKPSEPELILETIDRSLGRSAPRYSSEVAEAAAAEFVRLHSDALRMSALIEFQLELGAQRRPADILTILARAALNVIPSEQSVVTLVDKTTFSATRESPPSPNVVNSLRIAVETVTARYGWLSLMNRERADGYSPQDERIAQTIAAQAAMAYENLLLYEQLRQEAEKYRTLITNIPDVTWTADADGNITFVSANVEAMYGFTAEEIFTQQVRWPERIHPDDRDRVAAALCALFRDGKEFDIEYRLMRKDGVWMWVSDRSIGTYERSGVTYASGISHDVTARKAAEAELRRVARERELLLDSTGEGICAVDLDGRCTMVNRVAATMLGWSVDELIGSRAHDLVHSHEPDCAVRRTITTGRQERVTGEVFRRKDGGSFPVEYVASPIVDDGIMRGAVVTFSDVTERRKMERHLEQVSRISSLGRMAATIAHEFNNVMMGIQPFAELVRRRAGDDAKLQQAAAQILNSVNRGRSVTQDIMGMTKTPEPALQPVDVTEWLEQLAGEIRALAGRIDVVVELPPRGTLFARCDPSQMQQVVTNLALNARDAMSGSGTLTISTTRTDDACVRIAVADTGCGIPADALPFIFEPLFTTKRSGTGLGLAVAQQLVVHNRGTIGVESSSTGGTRFRIDLPETAPPTPAVEVASVPPLRCGIRRIVIVEDDTAVAAGLTSILQSENVSVHVVHRGSEAVDAVARFHPDVVLIDISLPDMNGTSVYEKISARWPEMAVVFSTGHAEESRLPRAGLNRVAFLRKPYSTETLLTKLREVCDQEALHKQASVIPSRADGEGSPAHAAISAL